jgi:DNA topoisomerase-6 subunit B
MTTTDKVPDAPTTEAAPVQGTLPVDVAGEATDKASARRATAEGMATRQRDISVSEFFTKNRHLLGFDNPAKALLTTIKEAVDNALDACEEAGILPSLEVSIEEVGDGRYRVRVEDNGPGIVKEQIPKIFAKLLYGSKFHRLRQSRGQQGIGISAAGMYGQLTTGKPVVVVSKIGKGRPAWRLEVRIDSRSNTPEVLNKDTNTTVPWEKDHGTAVEIELTGLYRGGRTSVDAYLEQTVVANPHLELTYKPPRGNPVHYPRVAEELPPEAQEIKPHPHGVELGMLLKIFQEAGSRSVRQTMVEEFSRVTNPVADEICRRAQVPAEAVAAKLTGPQVEAIHGVMVSSHAQLPPQKRFAARLGQSNSSLKDELLDEGTGFSAGLAEAVLRRAGMEPSLKAKLATPTQVEHLYEALRAVQVKILPPPATCVVPVGEALIDKGLSRRFPAELIVSHTRPPAVYRGNPFVVEAGIAYGGSLPRDESADVMRFANRVPLLYQPRACAITEAVLKVDWKSYGLQQRKGELPVGPLAIFVHLASVWVPFTSEAKEAVAHYEEIVREIRMALMECGRKLGAWVKAQQAEKWELERKSLFEKYIAELSVSIHAITGVPEARVKDDFYAALPNHVRIAAPKDKALDEGPGPEGGASGEGGAPAEASAEADAADEGGAPGEAGDEPVRASEPAEAMEAMAAKAKPRKAPRALEEDEGMGDAVQLGFGPAFEDVTPNQSRRVQAPRVSEVAPKRVTVSTRKTKGGAL